MNSRRPVNSDVMLLSIEQLCGSRFDYKLLHAFVRLACLLTATFIVMLFNATHTLDVLLGNRIVADLSFRWFFYYSAPVILSVVIFESFWFRRTKPETRPLAIDWFFVIGYLVVWGFGVVKAFLSVSFL